MKLGLCVGENVQPLTLDECRRADRGAISEGRPGTSVEKTHADDKLVSMCGDSPVNAHCLPFREIPHTNRLFLDYLSYSPSIQHFYARSPNFSEWLKEEAALVRYDKDRREKVGAILDRQNHFWGASAKTLANHSQRLDLGREGIGYLPQLVPLARRLRVQKVAHHFH